MTQNAFLKGINGYIEKENKMVPELLQDAKSRFNAMIRVTLLDVNDTFERNLLHQNTSNGTL